MGYFCTRWAGVVVFTGALQAHAIGQQTLIQQDGRNWSGEVKGVLGTDLRVSLGSAKEIKMPCADILAFVDESGIVHAKACDAVSNPTAKPGRHNCASFVNKNHSVIKGDILEEDVDYFKVRTLQGERTVTLSDVLVTFYSSGEMQSTTLEALKAALQDREVLTAMNNVGQCPAAVEKAPTRVTEKAQTRRWKDKLAAASAKPRVIDPTKPVALDTTSRGLLKTLDFDTFKTIAMDKVRRLEDYIGKIVSTDLSPITRDKAVTQAEGLFASPNNIVETSTLRPTGLPTTKPWPVYVYFKIPLRNNKARVSIEWHNEVFASDWEMQPDSSYIATISIQQRYTKELDGRVVYTDVTNKNIEVKLQAFEKFKDGRYEKYWDVFLGDIGVKSTTKG